MTFSEEHEEQQALFDEQPFKKRKKKYKGSKPQKKKRSKAKASIAEIIPIRDMTDDGAFQIQEDEGYMDMMQLQSKDIYSPSMDETEYDIMMMAKFFQSYAADIKIVSMNFPVDMQRQLDAVDRRIKKNTSPLYERFLLRKREELGFLEQHRTNREFYLFIYASSLKQLTEYRNNCQRYLGRVAPLLPLTEEKKIDLLYKLYNQNSKLEKRG
ncbi:hypothetical protein MUO14_12950 [Halobacillus shinanisalinarum]|uniref:Uncharacterized protein n=1 Tax=Halobacillus shinanisalinarum TaxID=2932258 RepID=A0ABY4GXF0_9BACI|nr:hypothetical protein [Halobacillus shinanisalinarum]UOQ91492.1 hypothetical protein MUO14_12950 [Halobacillus shinanisalinarum]